MEMESAAPPFRPYGRRKEDARMRRARRHRSDLRTWNRLVQLAADQHTHHSDHCKLAAAVKLVGAMHRHSHHHAPGTADEDEYLPEHEPEYQGVDFSTAASLSNETVLESTHTDTYEEPVETTMAAPAEASRAPDAIIGRWRMVVEKAASEAMLKAQPSSVVAPAAAMSDGTPAVATADNAASSAAGSQDSLSSAAVHFRYDNYEEETLRARQAELRILAASGIRHMLTRDEELRILAKWTPSCVQQRPR